MLLYLSSPLTRVEKEAQSSLYWSRGVGRLQRNRYSEEFKEQIVGECQQVGNIAVVARRHEISAKTAANWVRAAKARGSVSPLSERQAC